MYDVIVIGAGYGGVTCAALLAEEGHRVLLLDKNEQPGGKAMTVRAAGFGYELWPIAGGPADGSKFADLARVVGLDPDDVILLPAEAGEFRYIRPDGTTAVVPFSARPAADPAAAVRLPQDLGATEEETAGMMRLVAGVFSMPEDEIAALDTQDAATWVRDLGIGRPLESYMFMLFNLLFVVAVDRLPASEAVRTLRDFFAGGGGRYHRGGFARLAEAAADHVVSRGGEYRPGTTVTTLLVEDGRVVGVSTPTGELRARVVVSNAGIQPTVLHLAPDGTFPPDYVDRVRSLEPSWAFVGQRYTLDTCVIDAPMILRFSDDSWWDTERFARAESGDWPEDPLLFITTPACYDPDLAPAGQQMLLAGTMCSPDPDSPMNEAAIAQVDRLVRANWPDVTQHLVKAEPFTARHASVASRAAVVPGQGGECIGLAQVIGQCGATKPAVTAPVPGLYFCGCDAGGYGCGTHQAVDSGFNVARIVSTALAGAEATHA
ncbi:MAG: NAD(P)/FAD-dependent oxidoreductase [Acidimicrobiia bacterium]|nr:NAD(P)/FAD-dependent oxidoreductase [Acidimicrobiia bacterium]